MSLFMIVHFVYSDIFFRTWNPDADRVIYFLENFVLGPAASFWFVSFQSGCCPECIFLAEDRHISEGISLSFVVLCAFA